MANQPNKIALYHHLATQYLGGKCRICGTTEKLHIHHKDCNPENNEVINLDLLCFHHHLSNPHITNHPSVSLDSSDWTEEDEKMLKSLRRRKAKFLRDPNRKRKYTTRLKS